MPTSVGPNTYGEENLVFGYDLSDRKTSFKGAPATNLITSGLPGYFGSGGETLYQDRLYGLKSDSGVFQRNYVTNPAQADSGTYNNNGGLYKTFTTSNLNSSTRYVQITFDFYMITRYRTYSDSGRGLNGYVGITNTDSTTDIYGWNTTYSNGSGDDWSNDEAYVGQWQKVSLIAALRGDKNPASINAMYIYYDRFTQGEGIFTNFVMTEHQTFPTGPVRYTGSSRSATQSVLDLKGTLSVDVSNVSFDSNSLMDFDGTNDYVTIGSNTDFYFGTGDFTIEAVFTPTDNGNGWTGVVNKGGSGDTGFAMSYYANGNGTMTLYMDIDAPDNTHYSSGLLTSGQTYHIVMVYDRDSAGYVYNNGTLTYTHTGLAGQNQSINSARPLRLGCYDNSQWFMDGKIHMVKIYDRVLTTSEVASNYKAIKGRFNI